jgi:NTP pyrophosphatase (non-canonical NTP hydrolase)
VPELEEITPDPPPVMRVAGEYFRKLQELEREVAHALGRQGDDVCWTDLYNPRVAALVGVKLDPKLPPREPFRRNCDHFYDCLASHAEYVAPEPFTFSGFAAANRARCESALGFNHRLDSWSLSDWFTAAMGELGEAANIAKKLNRVRDGIPGNDLTEDQLRVKLRSEVADTVTYLDLLAQSQGFALGDAIRETFDAKSRTIGYPHRLSTADIPMSEDIDG